MPHASVNGTKLYYEINGTGEPILLLPGLGTGTGYYQLAEPILRKSYQTILVDPRGIGRSERGDKDLLAETWADDFAQLLDELRLEQAHILGSSHGGCMAMALADRHPAKVRSLVLIGAFADLDLALEMNFRLRIKMVELLGISEILADHITLWIMSRQFLETERGRKARETMIGAVRNNSPERYIDLCRSILHWGRCLSGQENEPLFTERLVKFNVPTIAITGDNDHMIPESFSKRVADAIPNARYVEIRDCGHIPVLERPEEACEAVLDFLEGLRGRT